ncbi:DUF4932 domain-containing protein [Candidatus Uabimicrobium amorphum]|uniref:DUF4932 domain-containing protein n=1 Tax=Uabimicrobium amorphum TaxID=2596890 RepID=A0A5S9F582_UABAM|nr:DUF4932 domain-containing protein [Candidatus Uabimicrobium amorphum]BBM85389.1 DUF4932 domain-containing protein [Candidatus Uabimicrobium amorphum]
MFVFKKIVFFIFFISTVIVQLAAQQAILQPPKVDKRVELLSIAFRLADSREYNSKAFPKYVNNIEKHFFKHKNHKLIFFIKNVLRKKGISFDAVMSMAVRISQPPEIKLLPDIKNIDERWEKDDIQKFVLLLKDFYMEADCETFFRDNKALYEIASQRLGKVYQQLDLDWYSNFYGCPPKGKFVIVCGLGNGGGNYGPSVTVNGQETLYAIMGTWKVDEAGIPEYPIKQCFPTLLHEFNHSFVNPLVIEYKQALEKSGKIIFPYVEKKMKSRAYGKWTTMYFESIVRACVIQYLKDHGFDKDYVRKRVNYEVGSGFLWTPKLLVELEKYVQNREKYSTLESFLPKLVKFFDKLAADFPAFEAELDKTRPKVTKLEPFENGSQCVAPDTKVLKVFFDREMRGMGFNYGSKGKDAFPDVAKVVYSADKMSITIEMKLQANKEYQMLLWGAFKSKEGVPLKDFEIHFKTTDFSKNN